MNRAAVIEQPKQTQEMLAKVLALLESSRADKFVAHLYQARKHYRLVCERPNKGNKAIEREIISSFQVAQCLGFNGDFRSPASLRLSKIFCPTNGSQSRRTVGFCSTQVTREPKFQGSEHR
jgi:hypothetical protein